MDNKASGQWRGTTADSQANIVLELDEKGNRALGYGYYFPLNLDLPGCVVRLELPLVFDQYEVSSDVTYVNPFNGRIYSPTDLQIHF